MLTDFHRQFTQHTVGNRNCISGGVVQFTGGYKQTAEWWGGAVYWGIQTDSRAVGWCSLLGDTNRQQSGGVVQFTGGYKQKAEWWGGAV
jgi:acyl-CoA-binding protein